MASNEAKTEVVFFTPPDNPHRVIARVIESPSAPVDLSMGRRENVLEYLKSKRGFLLFTRNVVTVASTLGVLDGVTRMGIGLSRGMNLESAHDYFGGILELILSGAIAVAGRIINAGKLSRLDLIRDHWVQQKISQVPLDQLPVLAEVAPQEG